MKTAVVVASTAIAVVVCRADAAGQDRPSASVAYDVVVFARDLMIETRDGVRLATDIYRPAVNGTPIYATGRSSPCPASGIIPIKRTRTGFSGSSTGS